MPEFNKTTTTHAVVNSDYTVSLHLNSSFRTHVVNAPLYVSIILLHTSVNT